ncbi:hypothetical protein A7U60_g8659 [Sanghuangporus baumii]|uniref:F-box domain-containing protein n=1 Tax=Sanghuangporus baumii TaxID=108892 RepID=A0A9Q5N3V7_SANBA|nr:hypothetical protein A7U60_g8659 [Sanghuangporus baumii]
MNSFKPNPLLCALWALSAHSLIRALFLWRENAAEQNELTNSLSIPRLPTEIWREIFIYAYEKHSVDMNDRFGPIETFKEEYTQERRQFSERLRQKLNFAQVSRIHWDIAVEFLYNDLRIYDADAGNTIRLRARELHIRLIKRQNEDTTRTLEAVSCILYCCQNLHSISITIRPHDSGQQDVLRCLRKMVDYVPSGVCRLDLEFCAVPCLDNNINYWPKAMKAHLPKLSFLRVHDLSGIQSMTALTHLYITYPEIPPDSSLWNLQLPNLELLHLRREAFLSGRNIESLFSCLPSLRVFEYHYINRWPVDFWTCPAIPPSLKKVSVKTFAGSDDITGVIHRRFSANEVDRFCFHIRPLFFTFRGSLPTSTREHLDPTVIIILPKSTRGLMLAKHITRFFPPDTFVFMSSGNALIVERKSGEIRNE